MSAFMAYVDYRTKDLVILDATLRDVTATINPFTSSGEPDTIETKARVLADLTLQVWGKGAEAVRADKILYVIFVALLEQGLPLSELTTLLKNPGPLRDPFARAEWERLKDASLDSVTTRLQPLIHSRIKALTSPSQAIDCRRLLDGGMLLANLSQSGIMGYRECQTLSAFLIAELWAAAFERSSQFPAFFLIIDEFATLANEELGRILTQAQKFGLHLLFLDQDKFIPTVVRPALDMVSCEITFLAKGFVEIDGWGTGIVRTAFEPEKVPLDQDLEAFRALVAISPKALPAPPNLRSPAPVAQLPGKGSDEHRAAQLMVQRIGEAQGYDAVIECPVPGGEVDVSLGHQGRKIAVEISRTSDVKQEEGNIRKCLSAGYDRVVIVALSADKANKLKSLAGDNVTVTTDRKFAQELRSLRRTGKYTSLKVASEELGRDRATVVRWCLNGTLEGKKPGRDWLITWESIDAIGEKKHPVPKAKSVTPPKPSARRKKDQDKLGW